MAPQLPFAVRFGVASVAKELEVRRSDSGTLPGCDEGQPDDENSLRLTSH